ncbi:MAG: arginine deiminase-related protein [Balneolaceae bacterium]|nr:arginine deiminase-related protein [Balneolaceae bacterium]MDR9410861.1 arginine deiminase-related protein [Balneolaceae bacterium]
MSRVYTSVDQIDFNISDLPTMPVPSKVLMVKPTYFDVEYVINPHMKGQIGDVDKMQAQNEWNHLAEGFKELGLNVEILEGKEGLPDMVFCANQSLPFIGREGTKKAVMGIMKTDQRKPEVEAIENWFRTQGYEILHLDENKIQTFEGMGDAIWHFKRQLLWGGHGFRSSLNAYEQISDKLEVPVIALPLTDETFYHLDTCMCILNESSALIYPSAFSDEGLEMIRAMFENVITATKYEAEKLLAVNAVCPDGKNVFIQQGSTDVNKKLRDAGFSVHEFSTYEFLKSGGSVFCMKLLYW